MIRDIVFEENYAQQVNIQMQQVGQNAFMQGRQQGVQEILMTINKMLNEKKEINVESVIVAFNAMVLEQQEQQT
jgi:hypothetical protein